MLPLATEVSFQGIPLMVSEVPPQGKVWAPPEWFLPLVLLFTSFLCTVLITAPLRTATSGETLGGG